MQNDNVQQVSWVVGTFGDRQTVCTEKNTKNKTPLSGYGAMISGGNLRLSMESINNFGNLYADRALNVDSRLFLNTGGSVGAGTIRLHADRITLNTNLQDALRQASMSARDISISGGDISLQGAKISAVENLKLSAGKSLDITTARRTATADLRVISGNLGNRYGDAPGLNMISNTMETDSIKALTLAGTPIARGPVAWSHGMGMLPRSRDMGSSNAMSLAGTRLARLQGEWQQALGSSLSAGNNLLLEAVNDLTLKGSKAQADGNLGIQAGGNVSLLADTTVNHTLLQANSRSSAVINSRREENLHTSELSGNNGIMVLSGNNVIVQGATVDSGSGGIAVGAKQVTIKEARRRITDSDGERKQQGNSQSQRLIHNDCDTSYGSVFNDRHGTLVIAGQGDLTLQDTEMQSEIGTIELKALGDILIQASQDMWDYKEQGNGSRKRFMGSSQSQYRVDERASVSNSSQLSGQDVILHSGKDISLSGSNIAADQAISLTAGNNIAVGAAENHFQCSAASQSTSSGLSSRGIGFSYGNSSLKTADTTDTINHKGSTVGSTQGSVSFSAGNNLMVQGSDVLAGKTIALTAKTVEILPVENENTQTHKFEQKQSGLTFIPSGLMIRTVRTAVTSTVQIAKESAGRLTTLRDMKGSLSRELAAHHSILQPIDANEIDMGGVTMTYGSQSCESEQVICQTKSRGSQLTAGGNVSIHATLSDITVEGSQLLAGRRAITEGGDGSPHQSEVQSETGTLALTAARDIVVCASRDKHYSKQQNSSSSKNLVSGKQSANRSEEFVSTFSGSLLSGQQVNLHSANDIKLVGSNAIADKNISLTAGNDISLEATENHYQGSATSQHKTSGLSSSGIIGYKYGNTNISSADNKHTINHTGSTLCSTHGEVTLDAGRALLVQGSDVLAGENISLIGKDVNVLPVINQNTQTHKFVENWHGLTLGPSGSLGNAVNSAVTHSQESDEESDSRLATLKGMKAALSGVQVAQSGVLATIDTKDNNAIGVSVSFGGQSHKSEQTLRQTQSRGSQVTATSDLYIEAAEQDVTVQGSRLQAGKNIILNAAQDINLLSAQNTLSVDGKNESKGGSIGVGVGVGQAGWGITVSAGVNRGKGLEKGNKLTHSVSTVDAGNEISASALRDTTLTGAQVSGTKVAMNVGRNLVLTSEQDRDNYDAKQQNVSAGGSFSFGSMSGSANVDVSRDKMHSNYASVRDQTGVFAGKGGFAITVEEHTQLTGAVLGSTADASENTLSTGTLGFSSIENKADFEVEHQSVNLSSDANVGMQSAGNMAIGQPAGGNNSGSASSMTHSAVSNGALAIRDPTNQLQDVASLGRDVEHAHQTLSPIFNKEKEQHRLMEARLISEIGVQAMSIAHTQGRIIATQAANEKIQDLRPEDFSAAETKWKADHPAKKPTAKDIENQIYATAYNKAFAESGFGTGGRYQRAIQAATAAVQGLAGGDMAKALVGASGPYVAQVIHDMTTDPHTGQVDTAASLMAHATLGALVAQANGNAALAGATGGVMGEYVARQLYPGTKSDDLSEDNRHTISVLSTLAAGLAGDSSTNAVAGAQAGKNAVENNFLNGDEARAFEKEWQACQASGGDCGACVDKYADINRKNNEELQQVCEDSPLTCASYQKQLVDTGMDAATRPEWMPDWFGAPIRDEEIRGVVQTENAKALEYIHKNTDNWDRLGSFVAEPENILGLAGTAKSFLASSATMTMTTTAKATGAAMSLGANAGVQVLEGKTGDKFDYASLLTAGVSGAAGVGKSLNSNVRLNVGGAYLSSYVNGEDSKPAMMGAALGTAVGFGAGTVITRPWEAKLIKEHFGMSASKNALKYSETTFGPGYLSKEANLTPLPGISGQAAGTALQEGVGSSAQKRIVNGSTNEK